MNKIKTNDTFSSTLYDFDLSIIKERGGVIVGVDEAGRGPLAGPVIAAAVVLDNSNPMTGINDSKKLNERTRELLYEKITAGALSWAVGESTVLEIEQINILQASLLAMRRALDKITVPWTLALIDGNRPVHDIPPTRQHTVVRGDGKSASIAAASILAKVTRDRIMKDYHARFPMYDFLSNKGYGTARHCQCIAEHGLCEIHRPSFCKSLSIPFTFKG
jgi:ribonuclease HII